MRVGGVGDEAARSSSVPPGPRAHIASSVVSTVIGDVFIGNNGGGAPTSAAAVELGSNLCSGNTICP
jgi:hypothetical protein